MALEGAPWSGHNSTRNPGDPTNAQLGSHRNSIGKRNDSNKENFKLQIF